MMNSLTMSAYLLCILIIGIIIHELTHIFVYWRITGKTLKLRREKFGFALVHENKTGNLTPEQYKGMLWAGIGMGALSIAILVNQYIYAFFPLLALYFLGCKADLKKLKEMRK